jgi:6-pyruvoyl-tetrahydropterin synthase
LFVDNLTNVDFSFLDPVRGLLGETWLANIVLHGELDEQGMVCDFGTVKKLLRHWLDTELDHRLAVPIRAPGITITEIDDDLDIRWQFGERGEFLHTRSPREAIALVDAEILNAETVAHWCITQLTTLFPESVAQLELTFSCETIDGPFYHYSHGLKKHGGNCQRIAHGHRSRIDIWSDNAKDARLEQEWAEKWRDIYIGTNADIVAQPDISGNSYYQFAYMSAQGKFELTLPQRCCYLIDTDTTVEFLARHIAERINAENPDKLIRVKAFEGINKGAIAVA